MPPASKLEGKKFGRLTVVKRHPENNKQNKEQWECRCDCGNVSIVSTNSLSTGSIQSCGCLQRDNASEYNQTHGHSSSITYVSWQAMKKRCYNENNDKYSFYGGRGIRVCDEWLNSFETFLKDMGERPSIEHSLERKEVNGNYEPGNCVWATRLEQMRNTRRNRYYEYKGAIKTLSEWCVEYGIALTTMLHRLDVLKLSISQAIEFKKIEKTDVFTIDGISKTLEEWCSDHDSVNVRKIVYRLYRGWTLKEALRCIENEVFEYNGDKLTLENWCDLMDLDKDTTYLRAVRGISLQRIVEE